MSIRSGYLAAILVGALWGALFIVVTGVLFTLVTGTVSAPPAGAAALAGIVAALLFVSAQEGARTRARRAIAAISVPLMLGLLTFMTPFGLPLDREPLWQLLALALFVASVAFANERCLAGIPRGAINRYQCELVFIRAMKGIGFAVFTIIVALPFYVMVMTSFKSQQSLLANPLDLSIDLSQGIDSLFRSYVELFTQFNFGRYLLVSAIVSLGTVLITLSFSVPGAYAVSRLRFKGRDFLARSVLLIYMVPAIVLVIPLYAVFSQLGLRNSLTGLLIVYPATTIPVALYMLQGYFRGLPSELEEAGLMDGLTRLGVIWKITLPLSLPALASVSLYVFMIAWNEFLFAYMFLDDPAIFTLSRGVVSLNSSEVPRQHLMAGAVVATVPVLVIFLWFERFLVQGLTAGSVKG